MRFAPTDTEANPHWVETPRRSRSTYFAASLTRAMICSAGSMSLVLLEMQGEDDARDVGHRVEDFNALGQRSLGWHAQRLAQRPVLRVHHGAEIGRVDLDARAAEPGQLLDFLPDDGRTIGEQLVCILVGRGGNLG